MNEGTAEQAIGEIVDEPQPQSGPRRRQLDAATRSQLEGCLVYLAIFALIGVFGAYLALSKPSHPRVGTDSSPANR